MGEIADMDADNFYSWDDEAYDQTVTCKFCGEDGLYWEQVDGKWKLYNAEGKKKEHICKHIKTRIKFLKGDI
jgi:hypothetical protein